MISMDLARRRAPSSEGRAERIFARCRRRLHLWLGARGDKAQAPARPVLAPGAGVAGGARVSAGAVVHDAVVGAAGSGAAGAGTVAAEHLGGGPAVELHQVALGAAAVQPGMAEVVTEPVREDIDAAFAAPSGDHLVDAAGGHRAAVRSEEHTSELQSPCNLVCRLLL